MKQFIPYKKLIPVLACICLATTAKSQLSTFGSGYYQNRYLLNPAMSGLQQALVINAAYKKDQLSFNESPTNQYLTADYGLSDKTGVGVYVVANQAGPLKQINAMGTYSYHIVFSDKSKLHMGLSLGINNNHLDISKTNGEADDPTLLNFNNKATKFEAGFGAAYTFGDLLVQASLPQLASQFRKEENTWSNRPLAFASLSYKVKLSEEAEGIYAEPMVCVRAFKNTDNIIDAGSNFSFLNDHFNVMAVYHTNKSITAGAGLQVIDQILSVNALYHSVTGGLKTFSDGGLEVGLKLNFAGISKKQ
jgi:type IX secretion system PorP/SprF family membrane protein